MQLDLFQIIEDIWFMVSISSFKTSLIHHDVNFLSYGSINGKY